VQVWSAHAVDNPNDGGRSAEHADAADRCARASVGILTVFLGRSRRLIGNPFGAKSSFSIMSMSVQ